MIEGQNIVSDIEPIITSHLKDMVDSSKKPYISIKLHEDSNYDHYIKVLAMVKSSIRNLKKTYALHNFNTPYNQLTQDQYRQLSKMMSITISESQYAL